MNGDLNNSSLKHYFYFWIGQLISLLGSIVVQFVIIWWITVETQSVLILSITAFLYFLPQVIFTPIAGVLIDRCDRKKMILIVDTSQAFLTFVMIVLIELFSRPVGIMILIGVNALRGVCQAFHYPTVNAIIPSMVPQKKLSQINGLNSTLHQVLQVVGPGLASFLLIGFSLNQVLFLDIFTFIIALIPLLLVKIPKVRNNNIDQKSKFFKDFRVGFKIIKNMPIIMILILLFMSLNFLLQPISVLFSYFINVTNNGSVFDYAFIMSAFHIGFLLGGVAMTIKKRWKNKINTIFFSISLTLIGYFLLSLSPKSSFLYIGIVFAFMGFNIPITNSLFQTILQSKVPREKFGRVFSLYVTFSWFITPIGKIVVGILGEIMYVQSIFLFCAFVGMSLLALFYFNIHVQLKQQKIAMVISENSIKV